MADGRKELRTLLRRSLILFIEASFVELNPVTDFSLNWHIELIAQALEDCMSGKIKRLIINVPPRSLKSHCVSVAFVAWLLGHRPSSQIICASYSQDLADKHSRDCRQLMEGDPYQSAFDTRLSSKKAAVNEFMTTDGGTRIATSVGGPMTGRGAEFIIIDDPLKPDEALSDARRKSTNEWFDSTVQSRLNDKQSGCIILIMQRLHEDDLVGHVMGQDDWTVLSFPAIAEADEEHFVPDLLSNVRKVIRKEGEALHPEREPLPTLMKLRASMGDYNFAGQYQQAPAPVGGGLVKLAWFQTYKEAELPAFDYLFQSWDTANTANTLSDYSVCTTWGVKKSRLYLLDVFQKRLEYPELKRAVASQARRFDVRNILIEDKASGTQLIQELRRDGLHGLKGYKSALDKVVRLNTVTSTIENGLVYLPDSAPWLADFLREVAVFPNGKHDDQVDSMSQALDWVKVTTGGRGLMIWMERQIAEREAGGS